MIGEDDLDLELRVRIGLHVVFDGEAGCCNRTLAGGVGVKARLVIEDADLDGAVEGGLGGGGPRKGERGGDRKWYQAFHSISSPRNVAFLRNLASC